MWAAGKPHADKLWPGRWAANRGGGKMIQHDLKAAGIPYEVDSRKADFHALRYTFITNLIKAGEHPAAVQRMARHSDINLTFRVYADLGLEDLYHGALRGPAVTSSTVGQGAPRKRSKRATNGAKKNLDGNGDESPTGAESVALNVALSGVPEQRELTSNVTDKSISKEPTQSPERRKPRSKTQRATGVDATCRPLSQNDPAEREGFEPSVPLRARRFSRPVHSTALPSLRAGGSLGVTRWSNKEIAGVTNSWSLKARHVRRPIPSLAVAGVVQIEIVASARPAMLRRRPSRRSRRSIRFVARSIL